MAEQINVWLSKVYMGEYELIARYHVQSAFLIFQDFQPASLLCAVLDHSCSCRSVHLSAMLLGAVCCVEQLVAG